MTTPTVHEVKIADVDKNEYDGQKAHVFVKTGTLGKKFLVKLTKPDGTPVLIALHL